MTHALPREGLELGWLEGWPVELGAPPRVPLERLQAEARVICFFSQLLWVGLIAASPEPANSTQTVFKNTPVCTHAHTHTSLVIEHPYTHTHTHTLWSLVIEQVIERKFCII